MEEQNKITQALNEADLNFDIKLLREIEETIDKALGDLDWCEGMIDILSEKYKVDATEAMLQLENGIVSLEQVSTLLFNLQNKEEGDVK